MWRCQQLPILDVSTQKVSTSHATARLISKLRIRFLVDMLRLMSNTGVVRDPLSERLLQIRSEILGQQSRSQNLPCVSVSLCDQVNLLGNHSLPFSPSRTLLRLALHEETEPHRHAQNSNIYTS
jgi:hypothetical protein